MASVILGGCPLRQLILAGEGSTDNAVSVLGLLVGATISHNSSLADVANEVVKDICFLPETSGGLLLSLPEKDAQSFISSFGEPARIIGRVKEGEGVEII